MRRRRSMNKKKDRTGAITVVLLLVLAAAFIYAFQSFDVYDLLFKPVSNGSFAPSSSPGSSLPYASASSSVSPAVSGKITEEIKMNSITLYGVQLGVFTKVDNAQATSDKFKAQGSAGYILKEDTLYRVVDSIYYNENDAKAVRDIYRGGSSPDACCLRVQATGINWKVSASREQIDAIKSAVSMMQSQIVILINLQKNMQQNIGAVEDWKGTIANVSQLFTNASNNMMGAIGKTNAKTVLDLNDCLTQSADSLLKLSQTDSSDKNALVSGLKYDIIDILLKLQNKIMSN